MKKVIVFEGLPGTGKTTISQIIAKKLNFIYFPEHIFIKKLFLLNNILNYDSAKIYLTHWEVKYKISNLFKKPVIFDRNHLTALSYNYAKSKILKDKRYFDEVIKWYNSKIKRNIIKEPDLYFILDIPPKLCNLRKGREEKENELWSQLKALRHSRYFYKNFELILKIDKRKTKIIYLDSRRPLDQLIKNILKYIKNEFL